MTDNDTRDKELMVLAAQGDDSAFTELIDRHQQGLANFFRRLGVGMEQTEDLVQDTLLKLHRARGSWQPRARFTTFLYTLARHSRVDWLRKLERQHVLTGVVPEEALPATADTNESAAARHDLQILLDCLGDKHREIIVLAAIQKFSYAEIADILEIPLGTVRSRLHKAMQKLNEAADDKGWQP